MLYDIFIGLTLIKNIEFKLNYNINNQNQSNHIKKCVICPM